MSLYSTEAQVKAGGKTENESEMVSDPEVKECTGAKGFTAWCYLFVHHSKVETISKRLEKERYRIFVHRSIVYRRENRIIKDERPTISGLVFIQGNGNEIQDFLRKNFFNLYLVNDCSTGKIAVISDCVMRPFMQMSEVAPTRIRFMPHAFDYYSVGNPLVRITSGILAGMEGYRIRISRDKCLVTSIGGMTVAIGGIHRESFENLDEYVRQRREQLKSDWESSYVSFTPLQQEIDSCFFIPQDRLDVMAIAEGLIPWIMRVKSRLRNKDFDEVVEIALFLLEEIGIRFRTLYDNPKLNGTKDISDICREADNALLSVMGSEDVSTDLKEIVESGRESLAIRFPFLPVEI